jgi:hypothetical protein
MDLQIHTMKHLFYINLKPIMLQLIQPKNKNTVVDACVTKSTRSLPMVYKHLDLMVLEYIQYHQIPINVEHMSPMQQNPFLNNKTISVKNVTFFSLNTLSINILTASKSLENAKIDFVFLYIHNK